MERWARPGDRAVDPAYIRLIASDKRTHGVVDDVVALEEIAEEAGFKALHLPVLHLDRGRTLIGCS
jgi:hypothetical protein